MPSSADSPRGEPPPPGASRRGPAGPGPAGRTRVRKALYALLVTAVFLALIELLLAAAGVEPLLRHGDPYAGFSSQVPLFAEERGPGGTAHLVTAANKLELFNAQRFPRDKAPGTYRIFSLGGSTTYGRPFDDRTSFSGWLRELLPAADPSRTWEVINAGGISYASYRAALLMEELARYEPDLFVVYSGHNEFLERRTYARLLDAPPLVRDLEALLSRTRTYSLMARVLRGPERRVREAGRGALGPEVETLLDQAVGPEAYHRDDAFREQVLAHYRFNLERMVGLARSAGAEIVLVTPASNLRSSSPFKSEHRPGLSATERARWEELVARGRRELAASRAAAALAPLEEAAAIDGRHAELHFLRGRALLAAGRFDEAKAAFLRAREEDVCPLRALGAVEKIVAQVAREHRVLRVDFAARVESLSEHGIPGEDLFLDHVHPTVEAHRILALDILEALVSRGVVHPGPSWGAEAIGAVRHRIEGRLDRRMRGLGLRNLAKVLGWAGKREEADRLALQAVELLPDDADTQYQAGVALERRGDLAGAQSRYERALALDRDHTDARTGLGGVLARSGALEAARAHLEAAVRLEPGSAAAQSGLAASLAALGDLAAAGARYEKALAIEPELAEAHNGLGGVLERLGRLEEAARRYERALRIQPDFAEAHSNLGSALARLGDPAGARHHLERAVELRPELAEAHNSLGTLLGKAGDLAGAAACYERAVRLRPDFAEAHRNLGLVLAARGDLAGARVHLEAALRLRPGDARAAEQLRRLGGLPGDRREAPAGPRAAERARGGTRP